MPISKFKICYARYAQLMLKGKKLVPPELLCFSALACRLPHKVDGGLSRAFPRGASLFGIWLRASFVKIFIHQTFGDKDSYLDPRRPEPDTEKSSVLQVHISLTNKIMCRTDGDHVSSASQFSSFHSFSGRSDATPKVGFPHCRVGKLYSI